MIAHILCAFLISGCATKEKQREVTPEKSESRVADKPEESKFGNGSDGLTSETFKIGNGSFRYVTVNPRRVQVHYLNPETGKPYLEMRALRTDLKDLDPQVIMNAGIYEPGFKPTGLLISRGEEQAPLNRESGNGNFFLKPNGVFALWRKPAAKIYSTNDYPKKNEIVHATQSGPLLIYKGKRHPKITAKSESRKVRNGVGILPNGNVVFAIANGVNLFEFGSGFEKLGCKDALYLDGTISSMWVKGDPDPRREAGIRAPKFAGMLVAF